MSADVCCGILCLLDDIHILVEKQNLTLHLNSYSTNDYIASA